MACCGWGTSRASKYRTEVLRGGLEVTQQQDHVAVKITNTSKSVKKCFTLIFTNCKNVDFPEGNPACFTLEPGQHISSVVCACQAKSDWKWNYRWSARAVFHGVEDDPKAFCDPDFPPDSSSVGESKTEWQSGMPELWVRARVLGDPSEVVLFDKIQPQDVLQGDLGDCWLMSALASLAEYPSQIRKLFKSKHITQDGKYEVQLFDIEQLGWRSIVVDEFIPCTLKDGIPTPTFAKPLGEEIWVMLLEKAVAKFCGSYGALSGGTVGWAFQLLTGEVKIISFQKLEAAPALPWRRRFMNRERQLKKGARNPMSTWWNWKNSDLHQVDELFQILQYNLCEKHMVTCMISKKSGKAEEATGQGLYKGHFYSLLQAREDTLDDGQVVKMVMLRNPWGRKEWQGDWSDSSDRWDENPKLKKQLHSDRNDGVFWMCLEDFAAMFSLVFLCPSCVSRPGETLDEAEENGEAEQGEAVAFPE